MDKLYHFIAGILIFTVANVLFNSTVLSLGLVLLVGALKEIYDKVSKTGTPEVLDMVATICGGLVACLILGGLPC